jgi:superfamily II DNA or RNA helicase
LALSVGLEEWLGRESGVGRAVERFSADCLRTYEVDERRVIEDANLEREAIAGGYARRQLYELIQNGADELIDQRGRVEVVLTDQALYCANQGSEVSEAGVGALLGSHNSPKTGVEIGRFGLGFKSVLGVSTNPAIYSRSGSFGFDGARNLELVRHIRPNAALAAVLRLAEPLDPALAARSDPVLAGLMRWASTVVVVPRNRGDSSWLGESIREFPRQFLLFSSHVSELVLEDRAGDGFRRAIELEPGQGGSWHLKEEGDAEGRTTWKLFGTLHAPSDAARADEDSYANRALVPINWAVPVNRPAIGQIWAFFPTLDETTLSGVINAPWKVNADRTALVPGPYNEELLRQVPALVVENLDAVNRPDDPGYVLELLPARGRELKGWADRILSDAVYEAASQSASLPDQTGALKPPALLSVQPGEVPLEAAEVWSEQPTRPVSWVHSSAVRGATRRSRVDRLLEAAAVPPSTTRGWLEALIPQRRRGPGSAAAVKVAAELAHTEADRSMRQARIVLTDENRMVTARKDSVYLPASVDVDVDVPIVAAEVMADADAVDALKRLGLLEVSARTVLSALIDRVTGHPEEARERLWLEVWELAARVTQADLRDVLITQHGLTAADVFVKSLSGHAVALSSVILPGDLLRVEDFKTSHRSVLVDVSYHRRELDLLRQLGAADRPREGAGSFDEPWLEGYRRDVLDSAAAEAKKRGGRARPQDFELIPSGSWPGPVEPLDALMDEPAALYARELLSVGGDLESWQLRRVTGSQLVSEIEHPVLARVRAFGLLPSSKGVRSIRDCVTPLLKELAAVLPVVELPRAACRALRLPDTVGELDEHRVRLALRGVEDLIRDDEIGATYAALLPVVAHAPEQIRAIVRAAPIWIEPAQVCVALTDKDAKILRLTGTPFVRLADEELSERLVAAWGLKRVGDVVSSRLNVIADGDQEPVADAFPLLRLVLGPAADQLEFLACRELQREMYTERGSITEPLDFELRDGIAYHLTDLTDSAKVHRLAEHLGRHLDEADVSAILENAQAAELQALLKKARSARDDAQRLALLIEAEVLRAHIPSELIDAVEENDGQLDHVQSAELALNVFGVETLKVYRDALAERGLSPPAQWTGRRPAVRFVTEELGFPKRFAGFADVKLEQSLDVPGPAPLPPLHPFQRKAADAIRGLIRQEKDPRGMLSLPTGAGKTRVTAEALIESIAAQELRPPLLWIAQTEELCEQAVQSWAEVWRARGPKNRNLLISRLWGGHSAELRDDDGDQLVVATIAKIMARCIDNPEYDWLREAGCLIVDEAHGSTAPTYTRLFRWLGIHDSLSHAPLIGLSATPFRGNEAEMNLLTERYGKNRLDQGIFEQQVSITLLQQERILARVDHQILEGSQSVPLNAAERLHIQTFRELPPSVLNKIGGDLDRTNRLVESVMSQPAHWPVLIFAASVAHAGTLAALIARRGRSAAAVSAGTPTSVRRHLIAEFRSGALRTLTNYGVLTQGFDAPSIRALYIARPTYSQNLYQQMIGRGLRGPANNGKEVCLVVDVADNVAAYGLELVFGEFEYMWQ